jgi:excisionase family DNA binding protein
MSCQSPLGDRLSRSSLSEFQQLDFRTRRVAARTYRRATVTAAGREEITMALHDQLQLWGAKEPVPQLLTVRQASEALNVSRSTLYELMARHKLEAVHIGRSCRIPLDAIASYIETLRRPGAS